MDRRRAAGALLALAACFACSTAAPTASNQTAALDLYDAEAAEGCYYNFQHYGEGDRIMTNEPCLNCTCHNRMLMCYLRVCPFTKPIGQDCTVEKRADQCCPIVTCPDVPVDLLTSTSTTSPAEYGTTGLGKLDKYGCSINGKYLPEGSKVPQSPNKPCEHCYCIRNMTTCVMQECTLHVDGCTPIYHKDVCCPVRYSCDHAEDELPLLDDMSTTVRPTPGFLLTTTTVAPVTQLSQECVHDEQIFPDGALIKTEKACEHCYCMKGDIVCVVQECGTPMENEGKNCTSLPPKEGQCCPDTYICEGDNEVLLDELTTIFPPKGTGSEGSGYRKNELEEQFTETPIIEHETEGSGEGDEEKATEPNETISEASTPAIISMQSDTSLTSQSPEIVETSTSGLDVDKTSQTTQSGLVMDNTPTSPTRRGESETSTISIDVNDIKGTTSESHVTEYPSITTLSELSHEKEISVSHSTISDMSTSLPSIDSDMATPGSPVIRKDDSLSSTVAAVTDQEEAFVTTSPKIFNGEELTTPITDKRDEITSTRATVGRDETLGTTFLPEIEEDLAKSTTSATQVDLSDQFSTTSPIGSEEQKPYYTSSPEDEYKITEESMNTENIPLTTEKSTTEPDKGLNTVPSDIFDIKSTQMQEAITESAPTTIEALEIEKEHESSTTETNELENKFDVPSSSVPAHDTTTQSEKMEFDTTIKPESLDLDITTTKEDLLEEHPDLATEKESHFTTQASEINGVTEEDSDAQKTYTTLSESPMTTASQHEYENTTPKLMDITETTSINPVENEIHEDTTPFFSPGIIPGEGNCLVDGVTYNNDSLVPSTRKCESNCRCVSSIVKCEPIVCSPPPKEMMNCKAMPHISESCCPVYVCDDAKETSKEPPQSHSQVSGTEKPAEIDVTCEKGTCDQSQDNLPSVETNVDCTTSDCKTKPQKPVSCETSDCSGSQVPVVITDVPYTPSEKLPEVCLDGNCLSSPETKPPSSINVQICNNEADCGTKPDESGKPQPTSEVVQASSCVGDSCTITQEKCDSGECLQSTTEKVSDDQKPIEAGAECQGLDCTPQVISDDSSPSLTTTIDSDASSPATSEPEYTPTETSITTSTSAQQSTSEIYVKEETTKLPEENLTTEKVSSIQESATDETISTTENQHDSGLKQETSTSSIPQEIESSTSGATDDTAKIEDVTDISATEKIEKIETTTVLAEGTSPQVEDISKETVEIPDTTMPSVSPIESESQPTSLNKDITTESTVDKFSQQEPDIFDIHVTTQSAQEISTIASSVSDSEKEDLEPEIVTTSSPMSEQEVSELPQKIPVIPSSDATTVTLKESVTESLTSTSAAILDSDELDVKLQQTTISQEEPIPSTDTPYSPMAPQDITTTLPEKPFHEFSSTETAKEATTTYDDFKHIETSTLSETEEQKTTLASIDMQSMTEKSELTTIFEKETSPETSSDTEVEIHQTEQSVTESSSVTETLFTTLASDETSSEIMTPQVKPVRPSEIENTDNEIITELPESSTSLTIDLEKSNTISSQEIATTTESSSEDIQKPEITTTIYEIEKLTTANQGSITESQTTPSHQMKDSVTELPIADIGEASTTSKPESDNNLITETVNLMETIKPEPATETAIAKETLKPENDDNLITESMLTETKQPESATESVSTTESEKYTTTTAPVVLIETIEPEAATESELEKETMKPKGEDTSVTEPVTSKDRDTIEPEVATESVLTRKTMQPETQEIVTTEPEKSEETKIPEVTTEALLPKETSKPEEEDNVTTDSEIVKEMTSESTIPKVTIEPMVETTTSSSLDTRIVASEQPEIIVHSQSTETSEKPGVEDLVKPTTELPLTEKYATEKDLEAPIEENDLTTESPIIKQEEPAIPETKPEVVTSSSEKPDIQTLSTETSVEKATEAPILPSQEQYDVNTEDIPVKTDEKEEVTLGDLQELTTKSISTTETLDVAALYTTEHQPMDDSDSDRRETTISTLLSETQGVEFTTKILDTTKSEEVQTTQQPTTAETLPEEQQPHEEEPQEAITSLPETSATETQELQQKLGPSITEETLLEHDTSETPSTLSTSQKPENIYTTTPSADSVREDTTEFEQTNAGPSSTEKHIEPEINTEVSQQSYSETTPYLVELEEHTHRIAEDVTPQEEAVTQLIDSEITSEVPKVEIIPTTSSPLEEEHITEADDISSNKDKEPKLTTIEPHKPDEIESEITTPRSVIEEEKITTVMAVVDEIETEKPQEIPVLEEQTTIVPVDKYTKPSLSTAVPEIPTALVEDSAIPDEEAGAFPPIGSTGYGQEPDYVEEDQAFGPGTCRYGGKVYVSAQQIPRDDPCDFCFCFRSDIICLQQSCPPPIHGCHEEPIQGFCCPRYECPVSMATTLNVTTTTTTTTTTLPPHFLPHKHAYKGAAQTRGCQIKGHSYKVGEVVRASSGPCLHCTCGGDGQMKCDPKACTPEPMLRQMIAAAVSAKRRR